MKYDSPIFCVHKLCPRLKFLFEDDDDNNAGAMTLVLQTIVTANKKLTSPMLPDFLSS